MAHHAASIYSPLHCWYAAILLLVTTGCQDSAGSRAEALRECEIREGPPETRSFTRCLMDRFGWPADSAHDYVLAASQRLQAERDSAERAVLDSLSRVRDSLALVLRQRDSVSNAAALRAWRAQEEVRLSRIWVASDRTGLYYKGTCPAARGITGEDRHEWSDERPAINAGFKRSNEPGC